MLLAIFFITCTIFIGLFFAMMKSINNVDKSNTKADSSKENLPPFKIFKRTMIGPDGKIVDTSHEVHGLRWVRHYEGLKSWEAAEYKMHRVFKSLEKAKSYKAQQEYVYNTCSRVEEVRDDRN